MSEYVIKDEFTKLTVTDGDAEPFGLLVNAKYDRVDHFAKLGAWMLKIFDDELGFVTMVVDEETALTTAEHAELPVVERETMFESEHEAWIKAESKRLEGLFED